LNAAANLTIEPELCADALPGYRSVGLLGQSSRYEVHRAWSETRAVPVAVKFARPSAGPDPARALAEEGRLLLGLTHPHVVRAYELHTGRSALVLELLPGPTLSDVFDAQGVIDWRDGVDLGRHLASALGYLHRLGYLHCDVKPKNVLIVQGRAVLIDLSLARPPGRCARRHGTQGYLAPEQSEQQELSPATDVWGLGLLLLEALSGADAYPPHCPEYREEHGPVAPPPPRRWPRDVPGELRGLVEACTALEPTARPELANVITALEKFTHGRYDKRQLVRQSLRRR
jgi:serine/threonine protein kinase